MAESSSSNSMEKRPEHQSQSSQNAFGSTQYTFEEREFLQRVLGDKLDNEFISQRPGPGGGIVHYIETWRAIELANKTFGFNGWSSSIVELTQDYVDQTPNGRFNAGVSAIVRISLKDGSFHEDIGYGVSDNQKHKGAAMEHAKKKAVSDGLKRALRNFGNALGLAVYDKEHIKQLKKIAGMKGLHGNTQQAPAAPKLNPHFLSSAQSQSGATQTQSQSHVLVPSQLLVSSQPVPPSSPGPAPSTPSTASSPATSTSPSQQTPPAAVPGRGRAMPPPPRANLPAGRGIVPPGGRGAPTPVAGAGRAAPIPPPGRAAPIAPPRATPASQQAQQPQSQATPKPANPFANPLKRPLPAQTPVEAVKAEPQEEGEITEDDLSGIEYGYDSSVADDSVVEDPAAKKQRVQ